MVWPPNIVEHHIGLQWVFRGFDRVTVSSLVQAESSSRRRHRPALIEQVDSGTEHAFFVSTVMSRSRDRAGQIRRPLARSRTFRSRSYSPAFSGFQPRDLNPRAQVVSPVDGLVAVAVGTSHEVVAWMRARCPRPPR